MKHTKKITIIILALFLITQFIGLFVINQYSSQRVINGQVVNVTAKILPYGMQPQPPQTSNPNSAFGSILISFILAIIILYALTHIKAKRVMKTWFFIVTILALGITFTAILPNVGYAPWIGLALAIPLAISKVYRRGILSHNLSELLIYPGIAAVFVPLINLRWAIVLLLVISAYDMWAVWKVKIMQKMAKYQMEEVKVFGGLFIPYVDKKQKEKLKKLRKQIKEKKITKEQAEKKGVKVNAAILGGGDMAFPLVVAGVVLKTWGFWPATAIIIGALVGLGGLLTFSKKKPYPAMPFISAGIFVAMILTWIIK